MLKKSNLINRNIVSFSNSFHKNSFKALYHDDRTSYVVFGGYNETQIVGGHEGLLKMPLADEKLNPSGFWGVEGKGFMYGNKFILNP